MVMKEQLSALIELSERCKGIPEDIDPEEVIQEIRKYLGNL